MRESGPEGPVAPPSKDNLPRFDDSGKITSVSRSAPLAISIITV